MGIPQISKLFKSKSRGASRLAIGFGKHGVYIARVGYLGGMPEVLSCVYRDTGTISAATLEKLRRGERLDGDHCTALLSSDEYQLTLVEAPEVPEEELKSAIRWKLKDHLDYHVDDAAVDAFRIPAAGGRSNSMYAVSAMNDIVRKRIEMFHEAGIGLDVIDIPEMALRNVAALYEQENRALALLAFDERGGLLIVTSGGELYMSRRIDIGVGQLRDVDENLRGQYRDRVELELQRSLDYFDRHFNTLPINRVLVSVPDDTGLFEYLASAGDARMEKLDLAQGLDISAVPELGDSEFASLALPTLGAALRREGTR